MPDRSASDQCDEVITKYRVWIVRQPALMAALANYAARISCAGVRPELPRRCADRTQNR